MTFADDIAEDLTNLMFDTAAPSYQLVTYAGTPIPAEVFFMDNLDEQTGSSVATAQMMIQVASVASPTYRDIVVIGGVTWYVRKIMKGDSFTWLLELYRDERPVL